MERIGFGLGYGDEMTIRDMIPWVQEVERRGFELAFFSETIQTLRDAVSALSSFVVSTSRIKLGCTQVVRLRIPLVIAQTFATLDELSNGRIMLSLGACTDNHSRKYGLEPLNPAVTLREHTELIKKYLAGGIVDYAGETIKVRESGLAFKPIRPSLPILIAATSRTGLRIAGALGDGVLLNATTSVEYCSNAIREVKKGAEEAGRNPDELQISGLVVAAAASNEREAVEAAKKEVASKFDPLQVDFAVRPRMRVGEPYVTDELLDRLAESHRKGGAQQLMGDISEDVIMGLTACGKPNQVRERVEQYRKAGVQLPIVRPANMKVVQAVLDSVS